MFRNVAVKRGALVLLLAGVVVGVADSQVTTIPPPFPPPKTRPAGFCTGGLFTLTGGTLRFYAALDDNSLEPSIFVLMRIISHTGKVVKSKVVELGPGRSAVLEYSSPGLYRVQAEMAESFDNLNLSDRRTVVGSVELFEADGLGFTTVIPPPDCTIGPGHA